MSSFFILKILYFNISILIQSGEGYFNFPVNDGDLGFLIHLHQTSANNTRSGNAIDSAIQ